MKNLKEDVFKDRIRYYFGDFYFEDGSSVKVAEVYDYNNCEYELIELIPLEIVENDINFECNTTPDDDVYCFVEISKEEFDKMIKINELVKIELDECCHDDYIEDYETPLDFYLSNVKEDDYVTHFLPEHFDLDESELYEIQNIIINKIEESVK